jgi:2-oxoglutarate ferredoxin oxidoreductase subunit beta
MKYFKKALNHKGTSVIEIITPCLTYFGSKNLDNLGAEHLDLPGNKMDTGGKMIEWIKRNTVRKNQVKFMEDEELLNRYVIGEFRYDTSKPEYSEVYSKIQKMAMGEE